MFSLCGDSTIYNYYYLFSVERFGLKAGTLKSTSTRKSNTVQLQEQSEHIPEIQVKQRHIVTEPSQ